MKLNRLEQAGRKNDIIVNGIPETYAERVSVAGHADDPSTHTREDTLNTICTVFREACHTDISPSDIKSAFRLQSRRPGPRPILVSLYSPTTRSALVRSRRPKETLQYHGAPIYLNDHLTSMNSDFYQKARKLVKDKVAFATWTRDGQVYLKWSESDKKPSLILTLADLRL
jgi:hypothetical protein